MVDDGADRLQMVRKKPLHLIAGNVDARENLVEAVAVDVARCQRAVAVQLGMNVKVFIANGPRLVGIEAVEDVANDDCGFLAVAVPVNRSFSG